MKHIFSIYKPKGPTSHDIINRLRKITGIKKIGHAGTLDPLAKGILIVGITRDGTKQLNKIVKKEKEYIADIKLGYTSSTDDQEGKKVATSNKRQATSEKIKKILKEFVGDIDQVPPIYSSIKIKGKPAHRRVRSGEKIKLESRKVEIKNIKLLDYKWPILKIKAITGSGVYIRSLARDIGKKLNTGGYLADLERIRIGKFNKKNSLNLKEFEKLWKNKVF